MTVSQIEQPVRWNGIGAKRVEAVGGNLREVRLDGRRVRVGLTVTTGAEGPVSHSLNPKLAPGVSEEFARNDGSSEAWMRGRMRRAFQHVDRHLSLALPETRVDEFPRRAVTS